MILTLRFVQNGALLQYQRNRSVDIKGHGVNKKPPEGCVARLTAAGRTAFWQSQVSKSSLPKEYLRMLGLVEFQGHPNVIRSYLRRYPDKLINDWLAEIEESGLLEYVPDSADASIVFRSGSALGAIPPSLEEDKRRLADESWAAGNVLNVVGVYVARERVQNRPRTSKPRSETEILVVEDDPDQLALAAQRVGLAGYKTRLASSGTALQEELTLHGAPDLLLLDVMLPDCDGFDILSSLRRHPQHSLVPIVMLTVKSDPADIQTGIALGADGYITKPYSKAILAKTIEDVLGPGAG